ncbi:hypothetical protein BGZ49_004820, partial [Haplosporangium sp. Z 27]
MRLDLAGNPSVSQLLERVHKSAIAAQAHQDLPFEQVVEIVQPPRRMDQSPLFQVIFAWQNNEEGLLNIPGTAITPREISYDIVKVDLELELREVNDEIIGSLGYATALFSHLTIERHVGYLRKILKAMVEDPTQVIAAADMLSSSERDFLLQSQNTTSLSYPDQLCVHHIFENQVQTSPDAVALVYENQSLTYRELNIRANSLAHHLISLGIKPDSLVAICVDRSPAMIIGLLAALKAGGAYVPLDPSFASERLNDILIDAAPSILLADETGIKALSSSITESIVVVNVNKFSTKSFANPIIPELTSQNLAYVIYTSGSTGKPKGVMIEHQGVTNLAMGRPSVFKVGPSSRILQFFSFSFDGSVQEIWSALCFGGILHILHDSARHDQVQLWEYLETHSITQATLTPTVLQGHEMLPKLSSPLNLILAGEATSATLIKSLRRIIPNGMIFNDYGPTETTVAAAAWKCPDDFTGDIVPVGRASPNKRLYVLDSSRNPVPFGVIGELYIGGAGVARGYLNRPDLTDKAFLPDPFTEHIASRMYKSGDLVRYNPDGNLVYLGRNDHQIKIRGFRVELGEIEARLREHPSVRETVIVALDTSGSKRLVAYVVADRINNFAQLMRDYLASVLPEYMVPTAYVQLDALPLTPNGKLDQQALPEPGKDAFARQSYEAPQ